MNFFTCTFPIASLSLWQGLQQLRHFFRHRDEDELKLLLNQTNDSPLDHRRSTSTHLRSDHSRSLVAQVLQRSRDVDLARSLVDPIEDDVQQQIGSRATHAVTRRSKDERVERAARRLSYALAMHDDRRGASAETLVHFPTKTEAMSRPFPCTTQTSECRPRRVAFVTMQLLVSKLHNFQKLPEEKCRFACRARKCALVAERRQITSRLLPAQVSFPFALLKKFKCNLVTCERTHR